MALTRPLDQIVIPADAGIFRGEEPFPTHCRRAWDTTRASSQQEIPAFAGMTVGGAYMAQGGWVYMMSNKPYGMLYIGVTAHLAARVQQHRIDTGSAYCRRYGLKTLVFAEQHETIQDAITREKQLKAWRRSWKDDLIATINPTWADLYDQLH